jgi:hypothetical protein
VFQLLLIGIGLGFLKQPTISPIGRTSSSCCHPAFSSHFPLEVGARLWVNFLATPDQYDRFVLFTDIKPENYAFSPHPYLGYYPTPNFTKGQTRHNSLGYRSKELSYEKPGDVFRIVALGGSSTYDVRIEDNENFTAQLEKLLKRKYGYQNVNINAGYLDTTPGKSGLS